MVCIVSISDHEIQLQLIQWLNNKGRLVVESHLILPGVSIREERQNKFTPRARLVFKNTFFMDVLILAKRNGATKKK